MKSIGSDSPVKRSEFLKETQSLRQGINTLDRKVNNIALAVTSIDERLGKVEETMMTKQDGQTIIDHVDAVMHRIETYDRKAVVHDERFNAGEAVLNDHEKRITRPEATPSK